MNPSSILQPTFLFPSPRFHVVRCSAVWRCHGRIFLALAAGLVPLALTVPVGAAPEIVVEQGGVNVADGGSQAFGSVPVGQSNVLTFVIRNTGPDPLNLTGTPRVAVTGANAADFSVSVQPAASLEAGAAATLGNAGFETPVQTANGWSYAPAGGSWTFGAKTGVARNGSPWFVNPAPGGSQAGFVQFNGNPIDAIMSQTVSFPSTGNYVVRFLAVRRGTNYSATDLDVRVDGTTLGTISRSALLDDVWRSFGVPYTCTAAGNHTLAFVGTRSSGDYATAIDSVQIARETSFQVTFAPAVGGAKTAAISFANNDADENPFDIALTGTAVGPEIALEQPAGTALPDGGSRDFGSAAVGSPVTKTFLIKSSGAGELRLTGTPTVTVSGAQASDFTVTAQPASPVLGSGEPVTLANAGFEQPVLFDGAWEYAPANAGWTFGNSAGVAARNSVRFPGAADEGVQAGFIQGNLPSSIISQAIQFPAPGSYFIRFALVRSEFQTPAQTIGVRMDGATLGTVDYTQQALTWRTFTVPYVCTSAGNHTLAFVGLEQSPNPLVSGIDHVQVLGASSFQVTFVPAGSGARTATLSIANNDSDENPYDVFLTGTGTGLTALESWRQLHFGTTADAGNAANLFDFDGDGLVNLVEFAFGLNPTLAASGQLPSVQMSGGNLFYSFNEPSGVGGITYGAEWSTTLQAGSWTPIPDTGLAPQHLFSVSTAGQPRMFLRFKITAP